MIRLVYLARLRDALGTSTESVDLPRDVATGAGSAWLSQRGGAWKHELAPGRAVRIAVNHDIAQTIPRFAPVTRLRCSRP
jgi:molybdopterin synthase sulfur carrier subunit